MGTLTEIFGSPAISIGEKGLQIVEKYHGEHNGSGDPMAVLQSGVLPAHGRQYSLAYPNAYLKTISIEPLDDKACLVTLTYEPLDSEMASQNDAGEVWEWNSVASNVHITSVDDPAKQTNYPSGQEVGVAIGVDGDRIEGVDVYRPYQSLRVTKEFLEGSGDGYMNESFRSDLAGLQSHVNLSGFPASTEEFDTAEVLFLGATMAQQARQQATDPVIWRVTYDFLVGKGETRSVVDINGDEIEIEHKPWDYVWFRYRDSVEDDQPKQVHIESVHVAKVYERASFIPLRLRGPSV